MEKTQGKKFTFPTAYGILLILTLVVAVLTHIVPAGRYSYTDGEGLVVSAAEMEDFSGDKGSLTPIPGSYTQLEQRGQGFMAIITAPIRGMIEASEVGFFVLIVGALLGVINHTKAIDVGIAQVMQRMKEKTYLLMTVLVVLFSIGGTTYGMGEETVAFYPILLPIMIAMGFDVMTAASVILLGAGSGVLASLVNPFATGIASSMAGVSVGDGMGLRFVQYIILVAFTIAYILYYAHTIKKNPAKSVTFSDNAMLKEHFLSAQNSSTETAKLSGRQVGALIIFTLSFVLMIYSVIPFDELGIMWLPSLGWWFTELSGLFLLTALLIGVVAGMKESEIVSSFIAGARDVLGVVLIIGLARGLSVLMQDALIIDTFLAYAEKGIANLSPVLYINGVFFLHVILSFFIPSTSGLATLSMPIMAPMADMAGVSRSLVITAYQSASGWINLISPTSGILMGALLLSKVPYDKFIKFVWPYMAVVLVVTMIILSVGAAFSIG